MYIGNYVNIRINCIYGNDRYSGRVVYLFNEKLEMILFIFFLNLLILNCCV